MLSRAVLAGLAGLATASSLEVRQNPNGPCPSGIHVIATGGANATDPYAYGLLISLAQGIVNAIPGSTMASNPYNKINVRQNPNAVPEGVNNLVQNVNDFHAACPNNKIALVGYSAGAVITMNGLCTGRIDTGLANDIIVASVVYGDQTRLPGQSYDLGTCTAGSGKVSFTRNPAGCEPFAAGLQSYCDLNDPECCDGPPEDFEIHFVYPNEYDQAAVNWVVQRYNQLGGGNGGSDNSTSSTADPSPSSTPVVSSPPAASSTPVVSSEQPAPTTTDLPQTSVPVTPTSGTPSGSTPSAPVESLPPSDPNSAFSISPISWVASLFMAAAGAALL